MEIYYSKIINKNIIKDNNLDINYFNKLIKTINNINDHSFMFFRFMDYYNYINKENDTINIITYKDYIINPFNLFKEKEEEFKYIINKNIINNKLNDNNYLIIKSLIDSIILRKNVYIKCEDFYILNLISILIPINILKDISFAYNININDYNKFNIIILDESYNDDYFFDFDLNIYNNYSIHPYSNKIVSLLYNSVSDAINYKNEIDNIINEKNINLYRAYNLYELKLGNIYSFKDSLSLKEALQDLNYNDKFIASSIYPILNKFQINKDILDIYKYVYNNLDSSHDYIIQSFFNNLLLFDINKKKLNPDEYLNLIIKYSPFDLLDYYNYLIINKENDIKLKLGLSDFNSWYLYIYLLLLDINKNKKSFVPNKNLEYVIRYLIDLNKDYELDLILNLISKFNKKAKSRLLYNVIKEIDKNINSFINILDLEYSFILLEKMDVFDSIDFYEKGYNSILDRNKFVEIYVLRENKNKEYYNKINELLQKDDYNFFLLKKETKKISDSHNIDITYLDKIYKEYYLIKEKKESYIFIDKILEYLNSKKYESKVIEAINIYDRYYKNLNDNFKDKIDSVRKINNFIYNYPDLIFINDISYYKKLNEINELLEKYKEEENIYHKLLIKGLDVKKSYSNMDFNKSFFNNIILYKRYNIDNNLIPFFNKYYLSILISSYYKYIPNIFNLNDTYLIYDLFDIIFLKFRDFNGNRYSFINSFMNMDLNEFKLNFMYFLIYSTNKEDEKYLNILSLIIKERNIKNKLFKEYYNLIKKIDIFNNLSIKSLNYIDSYILNNSNKIMSFIWKHFKK